MRILPMIFILLLLNLFNQQLHSQNYIANPSFEEVSGCPDDYYQIYKSPPWFSPNCEPLRPDRHGYAVLFTSKNPCSGDLTGVPKNSWCSQFAHTGDSYAGIVVFSLKTTAPTYRQYLETKLNQPLEAGKKYLLSMYYNICYYVPVSADVICFKTDSLGAYFSATMVDKNPNCGPLPVSGQLLDSAREISPSPKWYAFNGCFAATGNEQYLTIGNFGGNISSNCAAVDSIGYFVFIDDVSLIPEITRQTDTVICNATTWAIDAKQLRKEYISIEGWTYQWENGSNEVRRELTAPGNYTLRVMNKNCFADTYHFNITGIKCFCDEYIPNSFTPNGDGLNDRFIPHITCQNQTLTNYKLSIYNRWGKRIFSTTSPLQAWDGNNMGQPLPAGEYIYYISYKRGLSPKNNTLKGSIILLR